MTITLTPDWHEVHRAEKRCPGVPYEPWKIIRECADTIRETCMNTPDTDEVIETLNNLAHILRSGIAPR